MISENLAEVRNKIENACRIAGRDPKEVTLIAVSKTKPIPDLEEAYEAGAREYGENKVQEIMDKYEQLPQDIHWHMIGHLQRNKVKYIVDKVAMIHSVDSLRLAETIEQEAAKKNVTVPILIEVNVAEEESKFGCRVTEVENLLRQIQNFSHIQVKGLMTIAPFVDDPEENRDVFRQLKKLSVDIDQKNIDNVSMNVLSMGMTGDYEVAIQEGATMVRVGTGIFG
ncbi:MAG: YggS family pyridoxal phosphate-dependent enzyme, partial [Eubacteriales bacterium]|nr:YggS family pyridoxal phosphate-dependent enzyme [Eubacteriales bacterium]